MKTTAIFLGLACLGCAGAAAPPKEEIVAIFEHRRVSLTVPEGFTFTRSEDQSGAVTVKLTGPRNSLDLQLVFLPDVDNDFVGSARARKEFMVQAFQEFVATSVEQAMQFEELEPRVGRGTYCVFTDAALVGKPQLPPNEFLHVTVGLKAWRGTYAVFKLFSNDTLSAEYRALLQLLRESVQELPVSPLR
jgi:hypothetical protein